MYFAPCCNLPYSNEIRVRMDCPERSCGRKTGGSAESVARHMEEFHAKGYQLRWGTRRTERKKINRVNKTLKCEIQPRTQICEGFRSRSIHRVIAHLQSTHSIRAEYTADGVPTYPFPPSTPDEWEQWTARGRTNVDVEPSPSPDDLRVRREPSATNTPVDSLLPPPPSNGLSHPRPIAQELLSNLGGPLLSQGHPRPSAREGLAGLQSPRSKPHRSPSLQPYPVSQPVPLRSRDSRFPPGSRSLSQHVGGPSRNPMQRTSQPLHREQSESHPFLDFETLPAHPSQPLPKSPHARTQLPKSQRPSSSLQHEARVAESPREAPLPSQKSQPRTLLKAMPTRSSQTRPSRTESRVASAPGHEDDEMDVQLISSLNPRTATQRSRPPSTHANITDVEMVNVDEVPSLEPRKPKRPRSTSPTLGSNKRSKFFGGLLNAVKSPLKVFALPFTTSATNKSPTRSVSGSPRPSSVPVSLNPSSPPPGVAKTASPPPPVAAEIASSPPPVETGASSEPVSLSSSAALERDYRPASPAQREADIYRSPLLEKCDLFVLLKERVVVCTPCKHGFLLNRAYHHRLEQHKQKLSEEDIHALEAELRLAKVAEHPKDLRVRQFGEAPIEGIDRQGGYACDEHGKAWISRRSSEKHALEQKQDNRHYCTIKECEVQSILDPHYKKAMRWVRVDPSADRAVGGGGSASDSDNNCYSAYHHTWAVVLSDQPLVIPGPVDSNEMTLMERKTGWLGHLEGHIGDRPGVNGIMSLTKTQDALKILPEINLAKEVIEAYITQGCSIVRNADDHARHLLTECPRNKSTAFFTIPSQETVDNYKRFLFIFTFALMTSIETNETEYRFPLTNEESKHILELRRRFLAESGKRPRQQVVELLVPRFHDCIKTFLMQRDGLAHLRASKYVSVLQCFLAVYALRPGGILCRPADMVPFISGIKFCMRLCIAFEAHALSKAKNAPLFTVSLVEKLAMVHLNYAMQSEYVRISDTTKLLSALVFGKTEAANLHVSHDCLTFTYLTTTVHLPTLRHGLQKAVIELKRLFNVLRMGISCSFVPPPSWRDDWRTTAAGDSFLAYNKLFDGDPLPWLTGLLKSTTFDLFLVRSDGNLRFDRNGRPLLNNELVNKIFANDKAFLHHSMILCFLTSSGDRGTEFMEYRRLNGRRPRSIFISWDGELTLSPRRIKTEVITEKECFIPSLVPPAVAEILTEYLVLIRPVIDILFRIRSNDGPEAVHQAEFLWASEGKYPNKDEFGRLLKTFTSAYCGGEIIRGPWRQIITEIMRVYSAYELPNEESEGVSIHDARMGRSSKTSHVHYGSKDQNISTDVLYAFECACLDLHNVLGVGLCPEFPVPRKVRARQNAAMPGAGLQLADGQHTEHRVTAWAGPSPEEYSASAGVAFENFLPRMSEMLRKEFRKILAEYTVSGGLGGYLALPPPPPSLEMSMDNSMAHPATQAPPALTPPEGDQNLVKLRSLLRDPTAQFKSVEQRDAINLALAGNTSFMALLQPGEGKSSLYQLPALCLPGKTLVICPRNALLLDQMKRAEKLKIPCFHWRAENTEIPPHIKLIFVALESLRAGSEMWVILISILVIYLTQCISSFFSDPDLTRVALDEFHEFATTIHWRPVWGDVPKLVTSRPVQVLLLSGSVAFGYESRLLDDLGFRVNIPMIRSLVRQPAHQFVHLRLPDGATVPKFIHSLLRYLSFGFMKTGDQGIVFYPTIEALKAAAGENRYCASWADFSSKDEHESRWLEGSDQFIHSTSTCILGLDNERCNVVIFAQFPPRLSDILQGAARGGRRGQPTLVIFVTSYGHQYLSTVLPGDPECVVLGTKMLNSKEGCMRPYFGSAFNGKADTCDTLPNALKCQRCAPNEALFKDLEKLAASQVRDIRALLNSSKKTRRSSAEPRDNTTAHPGPQQRPENPAPRVHALPYDRNTVAVRTIDVQVEMRRAEAAEFTRKLHGIADLSKLLVGQCGACWALTGRLFTNGHPAFGPCSLDRPKPTDASGGGYLDWQPKFDDHTACFKCYMPQVQGAANEVDLYNRDRTPHPVPGKGGRCTHPDLFRVIAWAVFKTPDLLAGFNKEHKRLVLDPKIMPKEFAAWVAQETDGMINIGHLVHWLITHRQIRTSL
ncbi:hypothetical protein K438DRAFT_1786650 [Mycena galopus ATCC 62051]|nr:hypothetical protein K438DRAFT_1786650 [Mycena galopus ATCC 62051]